MIDTTLLDRLRRHDTPTVWNALGTLRGRTVAGFTRWPFVACHPAAAPMVGYALTARIVSDAPPIADAAAQGALRNAYYRYVGNGIRPGIVVMEDCGAKPGLGSIWGEVNSAIHRGLGLAGVVTSGAVRDLAALDAALPILAGSVCLGNGHAHLTAIDTPVTVMGLHVRPGDLIHADRHGAMLIPPEHATALPDAIDALLAREDAVIAETRRPGFNAEAMIRAWATMAARH